MVDVMSYLPNLNVISNFEDRPAQSGLFPLRVPFRRQYTNTRPEKIENTWLWRALRWKDIMRSRPETAPKSCAGDGKSRMGAEPAATFRRNRFPAGYSQYAKS
jgi:hypothetical protein